MSFVSPKVIRLWGYLRPYWTLSALMLVIMAILAGFAIALPIAIQYMIDTLIPGLMNSGPGPISIQPVVIFALVLVGIYLADVLFSWARDWLAGYVGAHIIQDIRVELFGHIESLSLSFFQTHQTGEIMSRLLSDVMRIQDLLTSAILVLFTNILILIAILVYLLVTNWKLTLVAIIPVPLTIYFSHLYGLKLNLLSMSIQQRLAALSARFQETLLSIKTVKAFGQEARERQSVETTLTGLTKVLIRNSWTTSLAVNVVNFVNMIGPVVVLGWGVYLVATGHMKLGELIAFYILLTYLYSPVRSLADTNFQVQTAMASVDRVFEYMDIPPAVTESADPVTITQPRGEIQFRSVSFAYPDSNYRLDKLDLHIRSGERVALVGPSGSGKTTIVNLAMRLFDPDNGEILFDGVPLTRLSLTSLRNHIALVDQDPLLFKTTIMENISYGKPTATPAEIEHAARIANIHDFIMSLPNGYKSEVGERGVTVSGGEKQRLCLARAVLKDPKVLILDEATSALDSSSEQLIQDSLKQILKDKTAILIAHRLSTVQDADRIIALDAGRIIDQGTHAELTDRCPLYRELAAKQLLV